MVPHESIMGLVLFNTFINNVGDVIKRRLSTFMDYNKLSRVADILKALNSDSK